MSQDSEGPFIIVEEGVEDDESDPASSPAALRLRREAMQRDELRRARSWSYVGAIVLGAGAMQLAAVSLRSLGAGDRVSIWLPAALAAVCAFLALRLFRRGRRISELLAGRGG